MARIAPFISGLFLFSILTGCGTFLNLQESSSLFNPYPTRIVYGGVLRDADLGTKCTLGPFKGDFCLEFGKVGTFALGAYALFVDLPVCLVTDTLTLPYVIYQGPGKDMWAPSNADLSQFPENSVSSGTSQPTMPANEQQP